MLRLLKFWTSCEVAARIKNLKAPAQVSVCCRQVIGHFLGLAIKLTHPNYSLSTCEQNRTEIMMCIIDPPDLMKDLESYNECIRKIVDCQYPKYVVIPED